MPSSPLCVYWGDKTFAGGSLTYRARGQRARAGEEHIWPNYIRRCREQWPERVDSSNEFKESLRECRTINVIVEREAFVSAVVSRDTERTTIEMVVSKIINAALAEAEIDQLELSDGAQLPAYLSSPQATSFAGLIEAVAKDLGPVSIVLAKGFSMTRTPVTIMRRCLANCFSPSVPVCWRLG